MQKTGQLLKEAREKKGLTIPEISHVTKINPKTLEALERGDISGLPQKAFVRGFVQTYAKYLGLDVNETLKLFQEEVGQTKPDLPMGEAHPGSTASTGSTSKLHRSDSEYNEDPRGKSKSWLITVASVLLILLIGFVVQMIQKYEKESELPKENIEVAKIEPSTESANSTSTTLDNQSSSTSTTLKDSPLVVAATPSTSTTTTTTTTTSTTTTTTKLVTTTTTTRATTTSTTTTRTTTTTTAKLATTTTLASDKPGKSIEVIVEALGDITLGFRIDSGAFMTIKLAPQQVHTFKAKSSLNVDVNDGGAINIIYNGQDRGAPGSPGQPIKLKYP